MTEKETFTREEVVSMLSGLYDYESVRHVKDGAVHEGNRGCDSGYVCVEDFAEPINPDAYIDEWKERKKMMSEKELEIKEAKEAIETLREYCIRCKDCDYCDEAIKKWCYKICSVSDSPCEWKV